jgi:WD40 repeat protein
MKARHCIALVFSTTACLDLGHSSSNSSQSGGGCGNGGNGSFGGGGGAGGGGGGGGAGGGGSGGGSQLPPPTNRGPQKMSDVHVEPSGEQAWIIHSAVADVHAIPQVTTAHFGAYVPALGSFVDVLDTTGTLGKKILFPANDRVLLVTQRSTGEDVFVTVDTVARRPVRQRTYPGDRTDFRMSPTGRAVIATNQADTMVHLIDTAGLVDQPIPGTTTVQEVAWASHDDVLYTVESKLGSTRLLRFDLRTADLAMPIARPVLVATVSGDGSAIAVSPDDRFAAVTVGGSKIALVDLTTAATTTIAGDQLPGFTNDDRMVVWRLGPDDTYDLRIVTPATGAATPPIATGYVLPPTSIPLRRHDVVVVEPFLFEDKPGFLYGITDGAITQIPNVESMESWLERPGTSELWTWTEYDDTLRRLDLITGKIVAMVSGVDSVDYRPATDDIVIGTFDHSVRLFSMATGRDIAIPLVLADPNDTAAPYALTAD